jgi:predicted NBD/HSP70 family sugar kinase
VSYAQVLQQAEDGDPLAGRVIGEAAHALGQAVAVITALTGVGSVILSGEGVELAHVAGDALRAGLLEYNDPDGVTAEPVIRPMGFEQWARGAAVVTIQGQFPGP